MGFMHETVADLKNRIQNMEGIPVSYQTLSYQGRELADLGLVRQLKDKDRLFLAIEKPRFLKMHKFSTLLKPENVRHLDD